MILYHGTNEYFTSIDLSKSRIGKDFGIGFYLTTDKYVAQRQAERKFTQWGTGEARVFAYKWEDEKATDLNILRFENYSLEWAHFILSNRQNRAKQNDYQYDIVIGPIADDTIGFQIRRFQDGIISIEQFLEEIKYHTVTIQYLFATERAIKTLIRL